MTQAYPAKTRYQNIEEARRYDRSRFHGLIGSYMNEIELRAVRRCLESMQHVSIALDVASGTGRIARVVQEVSREVVKLDISHAMLVQNNDDDAIVGDGERLPFRDNTFDVVTCVRLFGHLPQDPRVRVLSEMSRVSRGYVVVAYYHRRAIGPLKDLLSRARGHTSPRFLVDDTTFSKELKAAGLKEIRSVGTGPQVSGIVHLCEPRLSVSQ